MMQCDGNVRNWAGAVRQLSCSIAVRRLSGNYVGSELPERHDVVVSRRQNAYFEFMRDFNARLIRDTLRERDVALNPPATVDAMDKLTRWAGGSLHPDVITLLREFDGFVDGDLEEASFVSVWSIDKAIADDWTKRPVLAFSDWWLNAVIFGFNPLVGGPVVSIEDTRRIAPTYRDFWQLLLSDQLL